MACSLVYNVCAHARVFVCVCVWLGVWGLHGMNGCKLSVSTATSGAEGTCGPERGRLQVRAPCPLAVAVLGVCVSTWDSAVSASSSRSLYWQLLILS